VFDASLAFTVEVTRGVTELDANFSLPLVQCFTLP
jgi:hypothetical protein